MRPKINVIERVKKLGIWKGREQGLGGLLITSAAVAAGVHGPPHWSSLARSIATSWNTDGEVSGPIYLTNTIGWWLLAFRK
jgi:hypothetical protein